MKVIVTAPRGKMGKLITQVAASRDDMELVAGIGPKGRDYIGTDLGTVAMVGKELHVPVVDDLESVIDKCDVIIDFSTKEMAMEVLDLAIRHKKGLVCGSTGFSDEEMKRFEDAASSIPMLYAANTSKLVNVMNKVLEFITKTVGEELDIEILEMHDQWKKDAPSGTSSELAAAICPNIYGSSTIGVKKSTVCIIAISSVTLYIAASSDVSIPTIRFLSSNFGNLPRTWARVSGPILAAHPAVFVKLVSFTSDFILVFSSPWY